MLESILAPLSPEEFFRNYWNRRFLHVAGHPDKFGYLFPWEVLNRALEEHRFDEERLVLIRAGVKIDPDRYLHRRCIDSDKLAKELSSGATLIFNHCEEVHRPLRDLCVWLEGLFHHRVQANLYAGWRRDNGFDVHWDDHETLILQVVGRKHWKIWSPTRLHPFHDDVVNTSVPPAEEPVWDRIMEAGDLLYMPRGYWHVAYPMDEPCLHVTLSLQRQTGIDLLHWFVNLMKASESARMTVPFMATPAERAAWLEQIRADFLASWDQNLVDRFLIEMDARAIPRPRASLPADASPGQGGLRKTTRIELAIPRLLQFSTHNGKALCHAIGKQWQMDCDVAQKLKAFNDRRPHSLGEISPTTDIRVSALVGVLLMAGVLRRVPEAAEYEAAD